MSDETRSTTMPKWAVALLAVMALAIGAQSLVLFRMWRDLPRERPARGAADAESVCPSAGGQARHDASAPQVRQRGKSDPLADMDELWNGFGQKDWDPFDEMKHMREQMNSLFDDSLGRFRLSPGDPKHGDRLFGFSPKLDLQEKDDAYVASMDIPGANKNDISVSLDDRVLTVSGRINESTEKKDGDQVLRKERRSGTFKRSLTLPGPVIADKLDAHYENGVLAIKIPKAKEEKQTKTIPVQ